jgi:hypothetical protein
MYSTHRVAPDIDVVTTAIAIPGLGHLPVNSFVLGGPEPILVDTCPIVLRDEYLAALASVVDPGDLRWLWLTHTDPDHIGAVAALLDANPRLRVITTFFGAGIMGLQAPLPMDRVNFVNPGETIAIGDRTLTGVKPPAFDNPITVGFHDSATNALFTSDCFGALFGDEPPQSADEADADMRDGQVLWGTIDSSWLHKVDTDVFAADLDRIRRIEPDHVLSAHLPAASGAMLPTLLDTIARVPAADAFPAPDQAALDAMLVQMAQPTPV